MASFRFESAYYQMLIPDWLINMARFLKQICGIVSFFIVPYIRKIGMVRLYFLSLILNVFVRIWGVVLNNVFTPFIMSTVNLFYGTACTANADIMQQEFSTQQRATMHSIISFLSGILLAMTMILFGYIADIYNPRMAIIIAIVLKLVLCVVSLILLRKMLVKR